MIALSSTGIASVCGLMRIAIAHMEEGNHSEAMRVLQETIVELGGTFEVGVSEE